MRARPRLAATFGALLALAALLAGWARRPALELPAGFRALPPRLGAWRAARDETLEPAVLEQLRPDAYSWRLYQAPGRTPVQVYAAVYARRGLPARGAHDPRVCFPSQGWDILTTRARRVPMPGEEELVVQELEVQQAAARERVLYWFQPARRWSSGLLPEELLRIGDAALGRPQHAFVRLSAPLGGGAEVESDLIELAREAALAIRGQLDALVSDGGRRL